MTKRSSRRNMRLEKENGGCVWGLINLFDFRQTRNLPKLLSDRRHGSGKSDPGSKSSKIKQKGPAKVEESLGGLPHAGGSKVERCDSDISVKMLMQEEMSRTLEHTQLPDAECEQIIATSASEDNSKAVSDLHANELIVSASLRSREPQLQNLVDVLSGNPSLAALLQEFYTRKQQEQEMPSESQKYVTFILSKKRTDQGAVEEFGNFDLQLVQNHFIFQKAINELAAAIVGDKFFETKLLPPEKAVNPSDDLMNALEMMSSNNDLFLKLLKNIQAQKTHATESSKLEEIELLENDEPSIEKISNKNDKSHGTKPSDGKISSPARSRIIVLKPILARTPGPSPSGASIAGTSQESPYILRANEGNSRSFFGFSFRETIRRLKHAMGERKKEKHLISSDGTFHKILHDYHSSGDVHKRISRDDASANKNPSHCEQANINEKKPKRKKTPKNIEFVTANLITDNCRSPKIKSVGRQFREAKFQKEAKKHLVEMLDYRNDGRHQPHHQSSKSLENILALPEFNSLSPRFSPGRHKEPGESPRQMRFSPIWSPDRHMDLDRCSTPSCNIESSLCTESNPDTKEKDFDVNMKSSIDKEDTVGGEVSNVNCSNFEKVECGGLSSNSKDIYIQIGDKFSIRDASCYYGNTNAIKAATLEVLETNSLSNEIDELDGNEVDIDERRENDESPTLSILDASKKKPHLLIPGPNPDVLLTRNMEVPERIMDKSEKPSPISVLEAPFLDDAISPDNTAAEHKKHDDPSLPPRAICYDEYDDSEVFLTTEYTECNPITCMEDEDFKRKYVNSLLKASGLHHHGTWRKRHVSYWLLDPSLFDDVETPTGEIPSDLNLLFDCINEVLKGIHEKYFGHMPWVSSTKPIICPFPSKEDLVEEVCRGTRYPPISDSSKTLNQIIERDMDATTWINIHPLVAEIGVAIEDEILEEMLEETTLELCS